MTDENLVEEAAKAIDPGAWYGGVAYDPRWAGEAEHRRIAARRQAHSAFAVFEKAHTPTDDEREALIDVIDIAHDGSHPTADRVIVTGEDAAYYADRILSAGFRRSEVSHD